MKEGENLQEHIVKFDKIIRELKSAGAKIEEEDVVCHLLLTLPESFESVVTALETIKAEDLKIEFVKGRLLDTDTNRKTKSKDYSENPETDNEAVAMAASKLDVICYNCGKKGHYKSDCKQNNYRDTKCKNRCCQAHLVSHDEDDHVILDDHVAF